MASEKSDCGVAGVWVCGLRFAAPTRNTQGLGRGFWVLGAPLLLAYSELLAQTRSGLGFWQRRSKWRVAGGPWAPIEQGNGGRGKCRGGKNDASKWVLFLAAVDMSLRLFQSRF
jgi:hypothetical protein